MLAKKNANDSWELGTPTMEWFKKSKRTHPSVAGSLHISSSLLAHSWSKIPLWLLRILDTQDLLSGLMVRSANCLVTQFPNY